MLRFEGQSSSTTGGGGAVVKENNSSRKRRQISSSEDESEPIENNLDKRREQEEEEEQRQQLLPIYEDYQQLAETTAKTAEFIQSLDNRFARLEEGQQQIARYFESNQLPTAAAAAATATPTARKTLASKSTEFDLLTATAATAANGSKRPKTKKQIKEAAQFKVQELLRLLTD